MLTILPFKIHPSSLPSQRAGTPTAVQSGGNDLVTTAPAPTIVRAPMVTLFSILAPVPNRNKIKKAAEAALHFTNISESLFYAFTRSEAIR
jgi:hypothetical protein